MGAWNLKGDFIMENYIIDPSVFYWINVASAVNVVSAILGFMLLIGAGVAFGACIYNKQLLIENEGKKYYVDKYQQYYKIAKRITITTLIIAIILILIFLFMPGRDTCIQILVAKTATYDNVNWTTQQVKELVDYIVAALKGV